MKLQITINVPDKELLNALESYVNDGDGIDNIVLENFYYEEKPYDEQRLIKLLIDDINENKYDCEFEDADGTLHTFEVFNKTTIKTIVEKFAPRLNLKSIFDTTIKEIEEDDD